MNRRADLLTAAALLLFTFVVYAVSPVATPFDSRWSVPTDISILDHGDTDLNEYLPLIERQRFYGIECVSATGRKFPIHSAEECPDGKYYAFHPVAVPVLALPAVAALRGATQLLGPVLDPLADRMPTPTERALLRGDLVSSSAAVELLVASLIVAIAVAVFYLVARECLDRTRAIVLALLFAFCTPAWSLASRALWQHGPSMLLLILALLLLLRADRNPRMVSYLGGLLALAFFVRPTNAVPILAFTVFVVIYHRERSIGYLLGAAAITVAFCAYNLSVYRSLLAPYWSLTAPHAPHSSFYSTFLEALPGNLISPGRGLLVYVPLTVLALIGMALPPRSERERRLRPFLVAVIAVHWVLVSSAGEWIAGHAYGPRYMTDIVPFLFFFLAQVIARVEWRPSAISVALVLLAGASLWFQYLGAWRWEVWEWNSTPTDVNLTQERVWDWSDPPFLRPYR